MFAEEADVSAAMNRPQLMAEAVDGRGVKICDAYRSHVLESARII